MTSGERESSSLVTLARQILSYGLIGLLAAGLDTLTFWVLISRASIPLQLANAIGVTLGITLSFVLNRIFTFGVRDAVLRRFTLFFAVGLVGLALSAAILALGTAAGFSAMEAKLCAVIIVAAVQFVLNRTITFRTRKASLSGGEA